MSCFIALLKCLLCTDDDDRPSRHSLNAPLTRQSNSGATYSSYSTGVYRDPLLYNTALDRDPELYSKRNSPRTSQSNSGVTNSSFKTCNDSYPSQKKSTYDLNRVTVVKNSAPVQLSRDEKDKSRARDAVSGNDTLKLPYIPKSLGSVFLSGNRTVTSIKSESSKSSPSFQPLKPPPISTQPTIAVASSKKSTYDLNRATVVKNSAPVQLSRDDAAYKSRARDAGNDTLKGLSLSYAILSGNVTFTSIKSESPKSSPSFQPLKPPPISTQPTIAVASSKKSTYDLNRTTVVKNSAPVQLSRDDAAYKSRARDAGNDTLKGLSLSYAILSGNVTFTSIKSESPKSSPSFQPLKPPPISTQPTTAVASSKKSTYDLNRATVVKNSAPVQLSRDDAAYKSRARDAVSGNDTLKLPYIPKSLASVTLSGNRTVNSIKSESPKSSPSFQPLKPPPISTQPTKAVASSKKSTYDLNRATVVKNSAPVQLSRDETAKSRAKDAVFGNDTLKLPYIPKSLASVILSGNRTVNSIKSESPKSSPSFQPLKPPPISTKPTIAVASSSSSIPQSKDAYVWVEQASTTYVFPKEIKRLIEKDIVPRVLKMPLSRSSYKDYFHALLYAEDCYLEKWDGFVMENVKVELHEATIYTRGGKDRNLKNGEEKDEKFFVAFELDKVPERRPFLISRDFITLQPTEQTMKPFQGVIFRVVKSNLVLAEFGEEFFSRHHSDDKYDVKFSFNRVCLKRAHQAIAAASESQLNNLLFPNIPPKYEFSSSQRYIRQKEPLAVGEILKLEGLPPYLVEGPLSTVKNNLSKTGEVVVEAIIRILRADPSKKILLCAPMNRTCDLLMRGLKKEIAESEMFRANAAFREIDGVPEDILPSCLYKDDKKYFSCPEFGKLKKYKVISSTFISSYRLYGEGIKAGYFSHIFVVDASSATEPEAMVTLANFVTAKTVVVVTGAPRNRSGWIRSEIARQNGLRTSYFERLRNSAMYKELDPKFIVHLDDGEKQTYQTRSSRLLF